MQKIPVTFRLPGFFELTAQGAVTKRPNEAIL